MNMDKCAYCGKTVIIGIIKRDGNIYCNEACFQAAKSNIAGKVSDTTKAFKSSRNYTTPNTVKESKTVVPSHTFKRPPVASTPPAISAALEYKSKPLQRSKPFSYEPPEEEPLQEFSAAAAFLDNEYVPPPDYSGEDEIISQNYPDEDEIQEYAEPAYSGEPDYSHEPQFKEIARFRPMTEPPRVGYAETAVIPETIPEPAAKTGIIPSSSPIPRKKSIIEIPDDLSPEEEESGEGEDMVLTTGDLKRRYTVVGPIYFYMSNKGALASQYNMLHREYKEKIEQFRKSGGNIEEISSSEGLLAMAAFMTGDHLAASEFDTIFYIAMEEIKRRAAFMNADAVISLKYELNVEPVSSFFHVQAYGTAVIYGGRENFKRKLSLNMNKIKERQEQAKTVESIKKMDYIDRHVDTINRFLEKGDVRQAGQLARNLLDYIENDLSDRERRTTQVFETMQGLSTLIQRLDG